MIIGFFELRLSGIGRFPVWLIPSFEKLSKDIEYIYFYEQDDLQDKSELFKKLPQNSKLIKIDKINAKNICDLLLCENLDRLVVMAQRIPDSSIVAAAKFVGIKTIMYQHGLYVPFMKREGSLFVINIRKTYRFIRYALTTASIINTSKIKTLQRYINVYIFGKNIVASGFEIDKVNVDKVLVYGEFWKEYHKEQYGYSLNKQITVGAPDFSDLGQIKNTPQKKSLCYIAQTLVEDGRLPRAHMETFLSCVAKSVKKLNIDIYIRLHPRSDESLYKIFGDNVVLTKTEFPVTEVYLGHYSSLIAKSTFISDKLILVDFPEHNIPEYIDMLKNSKSDFDDEATLSNCLKHCLEKGVNRKIVELNVVKQDKYFDSTILDPLEKAAFEILK